MDSGVLTPAATASPSNPQDAAHAPEAARPSPPCNLRIHEDVYTRCECAALTTNGLPNGACFWCQGQGFAMTRRVLRAPDMGEQQALSIIKGLQAHLLRAANTLDRAASLLDKAGNSAEAQSTRSAAKAVRESAQE